MTSPDTPPQRRHPLPQRQPGQSFSDYLDTWYGNAEGFTFCTGCGCLIMPGWEPDHYLTVHAGDDK